MKNKHKQKKNNKAVLCQLKSDPWELLKHVTRIETIRDQNHQVENKRDSKIESVFVKVVKHYAQTLMFL